jgi:hypothetical protein
MHYGQSATAGTALGAAGIALGQLWLVAAIVAIIAFAAFVIRYRFRRGRSPLER